MSGNDPFYRYKEEFQNSVDQIEERFARWKRYLDSHQTAGNAEFQNLRHDLGRELAESIQKLDFLDKTLAQIDSKREQFKHIDEDDLSSRKRFVREYRENIESKMATLDSPATATAIRRDEDEARAQRMADARARGQNAYEADNDHFISNQREQTQQIVRQQEENLDVLSSGVTRLGERAKNINAEVEEQNRMLTDLDEDLDKVADKMNIVMGSLAKLLKTKDRCHLWSIVILTLIFIILVAMVIYM